MEIEFLGTGTSTGVPQIGCDCDVCKSEDARDNRLRTSVIVRVAGVNILIDCGPDFRQQILRCKNKKLDALLLTHIHFDHAGGVEDLRPYCLSREFNIYAQSRVISGLKERLPYCFAGLKYPGIPKFKLNKLDNSEFDVFGIKVLPLPVFHYKLEIFGYRFGKMAYITDCNFIPEETYLKLQGLDVLIINALRMEKHISHFSLEESLEVIARIKPKKAYLIHASHGIGLHEQTSKILPDNVFLAYDGLKLVL